MEVKFSYEQYIKEQPDFLRFLCLFHHLKEYPKNKNGFPDMRHSKCKKLFTSYIKSKNNGQFNHYSDKFKHVISKEERIQNHIEKYDCVVCMEEIEDNICMLKCNHGFCVNCFIQHVRLKNDCPLCREELCSIPQRKKKISNEGIVYYINYHLNMHYEERGNATFNQFLSNYVVNDYHKELIIKEIKETMMDVSQSVNEFYNVNN